MPISSGDVVALCSISSAYPADTEFVVYETWNRPTDGRPMLTAFVIDPDDEHTTLDYYDPETDAMDIFADAEVFRVR